ncbi:hypothetical protein FACHB389_31595 [Nostoc calcicola FACHB-389]|nr:hypothetical protein [Nostoc calcicola FACHB-3891]MDZ8059432.1 hypothetical protein [Nostoc sp. EkiNYC01]OKH21543.1 hypothetical protein FACHB389_31595 [Nostoc calcicola FACHB-389]
MTVGTNVVLVTKPLAWLGISIVDIVVNWLPASTYSRCFSSGKTFKSLEIVTGDLVNLQDCDRFYRDAEGAISFHTI